MGIRSHRRTGHEIGKRHGRIDGTSWLHHADVSPGQLREDPRFRELAIPVYRWIARWSWRGPPPRVLANSLPKAGTHLVAQLLRNLPNLHFSGRHHAMPDFRRDPHREMSIDWDSVRRALSSVRDGQYMTSHF